MSEIQKDLHLSATRIEEEALWLSQQLFTAEYMEQIFRMAAENRPWEVISHSSFVYYERTSANHFQNQLASTSARPVLRIREQILETKSYPADQGMVFQRPLRTQQPFDSYGEGTIYCFLFSLPADEVLSPAAVQPMIRQVRENGYSPSGDAFLTMLPGSPDRSLNDLIVLEFEVTKLKQRGIMHFFSSGTQWISVLAAGIQVLCKLFFILRIQFLFYRGFLVYTILSEPDSS